MCSGGVLLVGRREGTGDWLAPELSIRGRGSRSGLILGWELNRTVKLTLQYLEAWAYTLVCIQVYPALTLLIIDNLHVDRNRVCMMHSKLCCRYILACLCPQEGVPDSSSLVSKSR